MRRPQSRTDFGELQEISLEGLKDLLAIIQHVVEQYIEP